MIMGKREGLFVTFDGPNGVGKSSMLYGVASRLTQLGFNVHETKEPSSSPLGQFVRNAEEDYNGRIYAGLIAADRYFHLDHEVLPYVSEGKIVLSDRYVESSFVLQRLDGVDIEFIWALNSRISIPDLSVILTARPEVLDQRLAQRNQFRRIEKNTSRAKEVIFYQEVVKILSQYGFNILLIENSVNSLDRNVEEVIQKILALQESR